MAPLPSGNNERAKEKEMDKKLRVLRVSCAALARPLARATFVDSRAIDRSMEQPKLSSPLNKNVLFHSGVAGFWLRK